jgi:hypothetical protein
MFAQIMTRFATIGGRGTFKRPIGSLGLLLVLALLAQGCRGGPPSPFMGPDPSNPQARAPRSTYRSTVGSYTSQRPVDPAPWREQNERVAPPPKP